MLKERKRKSHSERGETGRGEKGKGKGIREKQYRGSDGASMDIFSMNIPMKMDPGMDRRSIEGAKDRRWRTFSAGLMDHDGSLE